VLKILFIMHLLFPLMLNHRTIFILFVMTLPTIVLSFLWSSRNMNGRATNLLVMIIVNFIVCLWGFNNIYIFMFSTRILQMFINFFYPFFNIRQTFFNSLFQLITFSRIVLWMKIQL
jgi:hypothetical protein